MNTALIFIVGFFIGWIVVTENSFRKKKNK